MRRILQFFMILAIALGQAACEGPEGPEGAPGPEGAQGPQGPAGPAGTAQKAIVFELDDFNFTSDKDTIVLDLTALAQAGVTLEESDIMLVYRFEGAYRNNSNQVIPILSALPQTKLLTQGILIYDFFHSHEILGLYLKRNFNLSTLSANDTQRYLTNQIFRFVIVPGEFLEGRLSKSKVDFENYNEVVRYYGLSESDVKKIDLK